MLCIPDYQIHRKIYESPNSTVYRASRERDKRSVILKVLKKDHPSPGETARYKRENEITGGLDLKGVIRAHGLEKFQGDLAIVLEDFGGESLKILKDRGLFEPDADHLASFLEIGVSLAETLGDIHAANVMHKDINPSNIVFNPDTRALKIIDFGISAVLPRENSVIKKTGILEGTLAYMSPEQTGRMNRSLDYRTDFYSLGATFYELLAGRVPFQSTDPMEMVHCHIARQPAPPRKRRPAIPGPLSDIVMKLLSKTPEDRYQSAYGIKADLLECLAQWRAKGAIDSFPVGQWDVSDHFRIPQKLYGREREIDHLMEAFDGVNRGRAEMLLVSGQPGVGKTALINEIHKPIVRRRGYFITGKFDPYKRNIPYASLIQAFQDLARQLATEDEERIDSWREKLLASLGPNGRVITDVIPEMEWIMGKPPAPPELSPAESRNRFNLAFRNFIGVFTRQGRPLAIFLDDLQWADSASLKMIQLFMTDPDARSLLLIGAFRDGEVGASHPLMLAMEEIRKAGAIVRHRVLSPLKNVHVNTLIAEALHCERNESAPLASLVLRKTLGNPFFVNQFLQRLYEDRLIEFDGAKGAWRWDLAAIRDMAITDNVVELMSDKIRTLSPDAREVLKMAACVGGRFDPRTISIVAEKTLEETVRAFMEPIREGLLLPVSDVRFRNSDVEGASEPSGAPSGAVFRFPHDRIQQAALSLVPEAKQTEFHLRIGRLLLSHADARQRKERIFDIVNSLNLGKNLLADPGERTDLARLNLSAGKKARASAAYEPALAYLETGIGLLEEGSWETEYDVTLALYTRAAEAAYLVADFERMEGFMEIALGRVDALPDKVELIELRIKSLFARNRLQDAIGEGLRILHALGCRFPANPNRLHTALGLVKTRLALGRARRRELDRMKAMKDPVMLAAVRILVHVFISSFRARPGLAPLVALKIVDLSLAHGCAPRTPLGFAAYGMILCGSLGKIDDGCAFGRIAVALAERSDTKISAARTRFVVESMIRHWKNHVGETLAPLLDIYRSGLETGNIESASLALFRYCDHSYFAGKSLDKLSREMAAHGKVIEKFKQENTLFYTRIFRQAVLNLMGRAKDPRRLEGEAYSESNMVPIHEAANDKGAIFKVLLHKMILFYLFDRPGRAMACADRAGALSMSPGPFFTLAFYFYDSLARLAALPNLDRKRQRQTLRKVAANQKKMKRWARHAPMNHLHKYNLARIRERDSRAMEYYDLAIEGARENGFIQEEALANELAAGHYVSKGRENIAGVYLRDALYLYRKWGAHAKVDALEKKYSSVPRRSLEPPGEAATHGGPPTDEGAGTSRPGRDALDFSTVIKASRAISGEIVLSNLLYRLMRISLENAGAQKGFLMLEESGRFTLAARGEVGRRDITVHASNPMDEHEEIPSAIVQYVARTRKTLILNDAVREGAFTNDPHVLKHTSRSIMCIPIINRGKLNGVLHLENNLAPGVFTPERVEVMRLLSSQVAISIENARSYNHLEESRKQLKIARDAAETSSRAKGDFLANMSHEIRTPMNGVVGMTELLMTTGLTAEQMDYAEAISDSARALLVILNDILDYSRIQAGKLVLESTPFSPREIAEQTGRLLFSQGMEKGVEILVRCPDDVPNRVVGDPTRLRQVLSNLAGNAIKFTDRGHILIEVRCEKKTGDKCTLLIRVSDTGKGIPGERLRTIFNKFTQADESTTRKHGGAGLGLAICKHLVEMMGGSIDVESEPGVGSTFFFHLEAPYEEEAPGEGMDDEFSEIPVLVVDDNEITNLITLEYLKSWNIPRGEARTGKEALQRLRRARRKGAPFRIALLDYFMPGMDGGELAKAIKTDEEIRDTMLILLSSGVLAERLDPDTRAHFTASLTKPVRKTLFQRTLMEAWRQYNEDPAGSLHLDALPVGEPDAPTAVNARVLLVEDNRMNQRVAAGILRRFGCEVDIAENGLEAVNRFKREPGDMIFMDVHMPVMDGFEATQKIREYEGVLSRVPIIAMTALAMEGDRRRCLQAGMDDYMSKPVGSKSIQNILMKHGPGPRPAADPPDAMDPPPGTGDEALPVMNPGQLLDISGHDEETIRELIHEFMKDAPAYLDDLTDAVRTGDAKRIFRKAHRLKGLAANAGGEKMREMLLEIENGARGGEFDPAAWSLPLLETELDHLKKTLEETDWAELCGEG